MAEMELSEAFEKARYPLHRFPQVVMISAIAVWNGSTVSVMQRMLA